VKRGLEGDPGAEHAGSEHGDLLDLRNVCGFLSKGITWRCAVRRGALAEYASGHGGDHERVLAGSDLEISAAIADRLSSRPVTSCWA